MSQTAIAFDTLAYAKILREAGISQEQAEALANAQKIALQEIFAAQNLAAKPDLDRLEQATKAEIAALSNKMDMRFTELEKTTKADMARLEASLIKWMLGLIIGLGAFLSALILGVSGKLAF